MQTGLQQIHKQMKDHLENGIIPFWKQNGIDEINGGYKLCYDLNGKKMPENEKHTVTQTRMIWGFSLFGKAYHSEEMLDFARQGVDFYIDHFWDKEYGGWYWLTDEKGNMLDGAKLVYGQSFAIYALSRYALDTGDKRAEEYAAKTFDLLQIYAADTEYGGYYENFERDWTRTPFGKGAGDIKSLNIHMHLLEAFTTLAECTRKEIHRRKLQEIIDFVLRNMTDLEIGCGFDQLGPDLKRRPAISIPRTWTQDREGTSEAADPVDTTFYGHNLELIWLLNRAAQVLEKEANAYDYVTRALSEHALTYGMDEKYGGFYYAGPYTGKATKLEKEWWENCEALIGLLDCYEKLGEDKYLDAFEKTWSFCYDHMINHEVGEWCQLVTEDGKVIDGTIGNLWKGIYHTGRSMFECLERLERIMAD